MSILLPPPPQLVEQTGPVTATTEYSVGQGNVLPKFIWQDPSDPYWKGTKVYQGDKLLVDNTVRNQYAVNGIGINWGVQDTNSTGTYESQVKFVTYSEYVENDPQYEKITLSITRR